MVLCVGQNVLAVPGRFSRCLGGDERLESDGKSIRAVSVLMCTLLVVDVDTPKEFS